ncbi:MAG: hypothetical protein R2762_08515 [Bryobacteraceae bacterium]
MTLLKSGTPFTVLGSDGPGFGNVDGNGGDRPNLLDPAILGRTVGHPDTSAAQLPRSAFSFPGPREEYGGNLGRDTFRKGGIYNVNASIGPGVRGGGDRKIAIRRRRLSEHAAICRAWGGVDELNFGAITNTLNDGRTFRDVDG